jgi:hypothetical protein
VSSELTEPFWAAVRRRELVRPVCQSCGRSFFTPQVACTYCLSEGWEYQLSSGRGTVYSATVVHRPPGPEFSAPFRLGVVDMDEGWSMLANLVDGPDERLPAVGAAVELTWIERDGRVLPAFVETTGSPPSSSSVVSDHGLNPTGDELGDELAAHPRVGPLGSATLPRNTRIEVAP